VAVPSVQGLTIADATSVLQRLGLKVGAVSRNSSMTVPAGWVISSTPDHGALLPGQAVAVVVSTGKPTVPIPSFSGANAGSFAAAQAALASLHLTATEHDVFSDTVPKGHVVGTDPPAGTPAIIGSSVAVNVSKGPNLVAVPHVIGKSVGAASQALTNAGFQVSGVSGNPIGTVTGTSPSSGTMARFGSAVQIITR
jgi:serine/threonine-protein kinase